MLIFEHRDAYNKYMIKYLFKLLNYIYNKYKLVIVSFRLINIIETKSIYLFSYIPFLLYFTFLISLANLQSLLPLFC